MISANHNIKNVSKSKYCFIATLKDHGFLHFISLILWLKDNRSEHVDTILVLTGTVAKINTKTSPLAGIEPAPCNFGVRALHWNRRTAFFATLFGSKIVFTYADMENTLTTV